MTSSDLHVVLGAGILGRTIARDLAREGARVRLVSRGAASLPEVEAVAADLADADSAAAAARGAATVYFCAAPPYQDWTRSFFALQEGAIAAARRTGAVLVVAENLYGYGVAGHLTEDMPLSATTRKGAIRAQMSLRLFQAHQAGEIRAVSGRAADFLGPGVTQSALGSRFWPQLLRGRGVNWFGDPDRLHSFTYLPDFARALITLGRSPESWGRPWHVPSPPALSLRDLATQAARSADAPVPRIRRTPRLLLRLAGLAIPAASELVELDYMFANDFVMLDKAWRGHFGTGPTDLSAALGATVAFWAANAGGRAVDAMSAPR